MSALTSRLVPEGEELSMDLMVEKYHEGGIWYGSSELNIGYPEELQIGGTNLIRLLQKLKDDHYFELEAVKRALDSHEIPNPEGLSQADRIHLLVGRKSR